MVAVLLPSLEHLCSWFIAERARRDPVAMSATTFAQREEGRMTNLGADRRTVQIQCLDFRAIKSLSSARIDRVVLIEGFSHFVSSMTAPIASG